MMEKGIHQNSAVLLAYHNIDYFESLTEVKILLRICPEVSREKVPQEGRGSLWTAQGGSQAGSKVSKAVRKGF
jgi:hypothetical protein